MPRPDLTGPSRVGPIGRDQIILRAAKALSPTTHDARAIVTRAGLELCSPLPLQPQSVSPLNFNPEKKKKQGKKEVDSKMMWRTNGAAM